MSILWTHHLSAKMISTYLVGTLSIRSRASKHNCPRLAVKPAFSRLHLSKEKTSSGRPSCPVLIKCRILPLVRSLKTAILRICHRISIIPSVGMRSPLLCRTHSALFQKRADRAQRPRKLAGHSTQKAAISRWTISKRALLKQPSLYHRRKIWAWRGSSNVSYLVARKKRPTWSSRSSNLRSRLACWLAAIISIASQRARSISTCSTSHL